LITLTTDFGYRDPFVGMMKGVILGINPEAVITDITHGISAHDVREAALVIGGAHGYFPPETVHVVVVDPGVGSARRPVLVEAGGQFFVGPDNGVFTVVVEEHGKGARVIHITREDLFIRSPGRTFDGRDVFAPVAAWLSRGESPDELGMPVEDYVALAIPKPVAGEASIEGEVIHIDRFGNAITNIRGGDLRALTGDPSALRVRVWGREADIVGFYSEGSGTGGALHALINSGGLLEIFVFMGNASRELGIGVGERVAVAPA
jgi:S-adenosylmethionine hydrolase